jgi:hypothetical protein
MNKITIRELMARLDSPEEPFSGDDALCQEFGIDWLSAHLCDHGFTQRSIWRWLCTDTQVGLRAIYWNGEFVCLSWQSARKSGVDFTWSSTVARDRVRNFLRELRDREAPPEPVDLINWDELIPIHHTLEFSAQISDHSVVYRGQPARVNKQFRTNEPNTWHLVQLEIDGRLETVDVREVCIPVALKPQEGEVT